MNLISVRSLSSGNKLDGSPSIFSITRSGSLEDPLEVYYDLFGSAKKDVDYLTGKSISVNFAKGSSVAYIYLPTIKNSSLNLTSGLINVRLRPSINSKYLIDPTLQIAKNTISGKTFRSSIKEPVRPGWSSGERSNDFAFAAIKNDGSVISWGNINNGGIAPSDITDVTQLYSNKFSFVGLKADGTVVAWGNQLNGGVSPAGLKDIKSIFSTESAFAALSADGTVTAWGNNLYGGYLPSALYDVQEIFSNAGAFVALRKNGTLVGWGNTLIGGSPPAISGVVKIFSNNGAFVALKNNGTITAWGDSRFGSNPPTNLVNVKHVYSTSGAFAALKNDGTVVAWGDRNLGGFAPAGLNNVSQIISSNNSFAALKFDGTVVAWGNNLAGGLLSFPLKNVVQIYATERAFSALTIDGSVYSWGDTNYGGKAPAGLTGVTQIIPNSNAFVALKANGTLTTWGNAGLGGKSPTGLSNVVQVVANRFAFSAILDNGSVISWGDTATGGLHPKELNNVISLSNVFTDDFVTSTPSYIISSSNKQVDEGATLSLDVKVNGVDSGSVFYWQLSGNGITESDFKIKLLKGSAFTDIYGNAKLDFDIETDVASEGVEQLNVKLFSDPDMINQAGSTFTVPINDTSIGRLNSSGKFFAPINGLPKVNETISIDKNKIVDSDGLPVDINFQWQSSKDAKIWKFITGTDATDNDPTYTLTISEHDSIIRGLITYKDLNGFNEEMYTLPTSKVKLNRSPSDIFLSSYKFPENIIPGTSIANLSALDYDAADLVFTYELVDGQTSNDNKFFGIIGSSLVINDSFEFNFDFEDRSIYTIDLRVKDAASGSFSKRFSLSVQDLNDNPSDILLSNTKVNENISSSSVIGTFSTIDQDSSTKFNYSILPGLDSSFFYIKENVLFIESSPDFEKKSNYKFVAKSQDIGKLSVEKEFEIIVADMDDPILDIQLIGLKLEENLPLGSVFASIKALDQDINNAYTYTLANSSNQNFEIIGDKLRTKKIFDSEILSSIELDILAFDNFNRSFNKKFNIPISNINESPTDLNISISSFSENYAKGAVLGSLSHKDPDKNGSYLYSFASGEGASDNDSFKIIGTNLVFDGVADYELKKFFNIRLKVVDQGGLAFEKSFSLSVRNVIEKISTSNSHNLSDSYDTLVLFGARNINGVGNRFDNTLVGNAGNNSLTGGLGKDTLTGGSGFDTFIYNSLSESTIIGYDIITDYVAGERIIVNTLGYNGINLINIVGTTSTLSAESIESILTSSSFLPNSPAAFNVAALDKSGKLLFPGTFLALNDLVGGYQSASDALIYFPNYMVSSLNSISVI